MIPGHSTKPETQPSTIQPAALLLAPIGRDADLAAAMLKEEGLESIICRSTAELLQRLVDDDYGPVVIAEEAVNTEEATALETILDTQPVWSDSSLIIFTGSGSTSKKLKNLVARHNTTLLRRPIKSATFITIVRAAMQDRLRQFQMRDLIAELQMRTRQLQRLALQLSEAEERERNRLALILHDDLQQLLAGAGYQLEILGRRAGGSGVQQLVAGLETTLEQAVEITRSLSHQLSPPTLRQHGLAAALHWLADRMFQMHNLRVIVESGQEVDPSEMPLRLFLFRSAQEFLFNVSKHAGTDEARLRLAQTEGGIELCVQDNGKGFDSQAIAEQDDSCLTGLGVLSIRERANYLGGEVRITSAPGKGCSIKLLLPRKLEGWTKAGRRKTDLSSQGTDVEKHEAGSSRSNRIMVVLADDHQVMRSGLKSLLEDQEMIEIVGEAENGSDAVDLAYRLHPDVILMDVAMPVMNGIEATSRIKARHPDIRIIGLSMFNDPETAIRMYEAGADEYLSKTESGEKLIKAIVGGPADNS
jgi:signal transduction histidine kinase/CheY-like chemotaxis protein